MNLHPEAERIYRERTPRSRELLERNRALIPTGQTGGMWYQLPYPTVVERAAGTRIWDVDGNEYHDFRIGDWLLIHGHGNAAIREAIVAQLDWGIQFGAPEWDLGHRMATLLAERMPSIEKVRFAISGTENNQIALRLARTFTGRAKMAKMAARLPRRRRSAARRQNGDRVSTRTRSRRAFCAARSTRSWCCRSTTPTRPRS